MNKKKDLNFFKFEFEFKIELLYYLNIITKIEYKVIFLLFIELCTKQYNVVLLKYRIYGNSTFWNTQEYLYKYKHIQELGIFVPNKVISCTYIIYAQYTSVYTRPAQFYHY